MAWQFLTFIAMITFSVAVLLQRVLLHKDKGDAIAYVVVFQGMVGVVTGLFALVRGFEMPDLGQLWLPILVTCLLFAVENIFYAKALQRVEVSVFSTLYATNIFWIMLAGYVLFDEQIGLWQIAGALLVFGSVAILTDRSGTIKLNKGVWYALATGFTFGLAGSGWAYVGRSADAASWTAMSFGVPGLMVLAANPGAARKLHPFFKGRMFARVALLGLLVGTAAICLMYAYQAGDVSVIAPLQQSSMILTIILAVIFLHERTRLRQKALAAAICFLGVLLLV